MEISRMARSVDLRQNRKRLTANHTLVFDPLVLAIDGSVRFHSISNVLFCLGKATAQCAPSLQTGCSSTAGQQIA